jgi:hypothetical protein
MIFNVRAKKRKLLRSHTCDAQNLGPSPALAYVVTAFHLSTSR